MRVAASALVVVIASRVASAETVDDTEAMTTPGAPGAASPAFVMLDRQDGVSRAGGDVTYVGAEMSEATLVRLDLHGQYVEPATRLGGYASVPLALSTSTMEREGAAVLGNLSLGGLYLPYAGSTTTLVLHAGVIVPTARKGIADGFAGIVAGYVRPQDLYRALPRTFAARAGLSPIFRTGPSSVLRLDLGVDVALDGGVEDNATPAFHVDVGLGLLLTPTATLAFELVTNTIDLDNDSETNATFAIALRFAAAHILPHVALVLPIDGATGSFIEAGLVLGIETRL